MDNAQDKSGVPHCHKEANGEYHLLGYEAMKYVGYTASYPRK
jgi:hypothetical protein